MRSSNRSSLEGTHEWNDEFSRIVLVTSKSGFARLADGLGPAREPGLALGARRSSISEAFGTYAPGLPWAS